MITRDLCLSLPLLNTHLPRRVCFRTFDPVGPPELTVRPLDLGGGTTLGRFHDLVPSLFESSKICKKFVKVSSSMSRATSRNTIFVYSDDGGGVSRRTETFVVNGELLSLY